MAAITTRLHHLRSLPRPLRHFSSPSDPPEPVSEPDSNQTRSKPTFSSYLNDVKASLQREPHPHDRPRRPLSNTSQPPPSLDGIRRSLAKYRLRSAAPSSGHHVSFRELDKSNVISKSDDAIKPLSFDSIRDSLRNMPKNRNGVGGRSGEVRSEPLIVGGSDGDGGGGGISSAIFMKEKKNAGWMKSTLFELYTYADLGRKLETLRPEKTTKKGDWFSLQELNERLVRLRKIEEESQGRMGGVTFRDLRESLDQMKRSEEEQKREKTMQRLEALAQLGTTPGIMLSAPKEHLVEKYFHPDNMSSAEKLKLELKKVRDDFKMSESDCGSARVQVAQLTTKIKHLSTVLQKKDKHSRKGLQAMVQRRKKLLKYLRRTDWDSYSLVLSKLGLRDNPDIKIKA